MGSPWDVVKKVGGAVVGGTAGIALGGPLGIPGAVAGIGGAIAGGSDPAQKAMEKSLKTAAEVGKKIAVGVGEVIIKAGEFGLDVVNSLIPGTIGIRPMRQSEIEIADRVFNKNLRTLQTHRIRIISISGMNDRPFCIPGSLIGTLGFAVPLFGPLLAWTSIVTGLANEYVIFFGEKGFRDSINYKLKPGTVIPGQKLVHELVHVWQGHRRLFAPEYVINSLWNQCTCGIAGNVDDAYDYKQTGKQWAQYTPEEQGRLVEDWFRTTQGATNETLDSARQPYIDTNIRAGSLDAKISSFSTTATSLSVGLGGATMTQLLDALDALRMRRNMFAAMGYTPVAMAELAKLTPEIARLEAMVRVLVSKGFLIEDRAMFASNPGSGPHVSSTGPAKGSPILRR